VEVLKQRIRTFPSEASHSWLILGGIYSRPEVNDKAQALQSYRYALTLTPGYLRSGVKASIPEEYQRQL
jgi:cytochrome c-type biogenesis protein CcmH/NrfG